MQQQVLDHHEHEIDNNNEDDEDYDDDDDEDADDNSDGDDDDEKVNLPMVGCQLERRILAATSSGNYLQASSSLST